ncbi:hypothetical protein VTN96DRAFT_5265 [Rasamsonia emersonii]
MPSLTVPPQRRRRRRNDDSNDDDDDESRQPSPLSQSSTSSKRIKLGNPPEESEDEVEDPSEDEIADPDDENEDDDDGNESASNSQRDQHSGPAATSIPPSMSSKSQGPSGGDSGGYGEFQPGAIVRIKLKDFVTYTSAEFFPGPKLNMVIGPNGTGKSTLVCAICLGLGWGPQHLGRAKDPGEFVKHGCREATIEIELARGGPFKRNPVICRTIKREGNKSTFTVNGKEASRKQVLKIAQSFSIQIDNLCQFLPQDKVSEFAALTPVELLHSTQRAAAGPQMLEWHENLKKLRAEQKKLLADNKSDRDLLANLENRQEMQRADVERYKQRAEIKRRIEMLEFSRPIPRYKDHHEKFQEAKRKKDELERELEQLKAELEPALRAVNAKQQYCLRLDEVVKYKRQQFSRAETAAAEIAKRMEQHEDAMKDLAGQVEAERKSGTNYKEELKKIQQNINRITRQMEEEPVEFDIDSYNERIRDKKREIREIETRAKELKDARRPLFEELQDKKSRIEQAERQLKSLDSQAGQQEAKLKQISPESYRAYQWILSNPDKFEKEVFGPPIVTCSVKNPKYADALESLMQRTDFTAFTTQTRNDFKTLQRALNIEMKLHDISIRTCSVPLENFKSPVSDEQLRDLGFDGWAKDFLTGPEPVLAALCSEIRLHQTPVALRDISDEEYSNLENGPMSSWVAGKRSYQVIRRREYGPSATSTRVRLIKPARIWTNQPVDAGAKQELLQSIAEWKDDIREVQQKIDADKAELARLSEEHNLKTKERVELEQEKSAKQTALINYRALPERLNQQRLKQKEVEKHFEAIRARVIEIRSKQDQVAIEKAETAIEYAKAVEKLHKIHEEFVIAEIRHIEALSDFETLKERNSEVRETLEAKREEVKEAVRHLKTVSEIGRKLAEEAAKVVQASNSQPDLKELLDTTVKGLSLDELEANIDSEKARLELTQGGSANLLKEFEERERQIQKLREKLAGYESSLADYEHAINEIRGQWEPRLDALVQKISDAFSDSFARIGCAGQVRIDKVEDPPGPNGEPGGSDFDQWSIQILVKFREHENLSLLDSHRQSGGERAVSTIFYLMALQSLSASPFRVVDEINQGMDPRNERMVHERMVDIACAPRTANSSGDGVGGAGGSQYFLITPKLLSGLVYKPGMKVLCIVSGEHMPADYNLVDFGRAIRRMREISGVPAAANGDSSSSSRRDKGKGKARAVAEGSTRVDVRA